MEWIIEYDRTKMDAKCPGCIKFYKLLDDVAADDLKNVVQLTPHKARVNIKKQFLDEYNSVKFITEEEIIKDEINK